MGKQQRSHVRNLSINKTGKGYALYNKQKGTYSQFFLKLNYSGQVKPTIP